MADHVHTPAARNFPPGATRKRPLIYVCVAVPAQAAPPAGCSVFALFATPHCAVLSHACCAHPPMAMLCHALAATSCLQTTTP